MDSQLPTCTEGLQVERLRGTPGEPELRVGGDAVRVARRRLPPSHWWCAFGSSCVSLSPIQQASLLAGGAGGLAPLQGARLSGERNSTVSRESGSTQLLHHKQGLKGVVRLWPSTLIEPHPVLLQLDVLALALPPRS